MRRAMVLAAVLFVFSIFASEALAAQEYALRGGKVFRISAKGTEKHLLKAKAEVHKLSDNRRIYTLAVDGDIENMYRGSKKGIHFFGNDEKFISFLPWDMAEFSFVHFSPDGKQFVLDSGTYVIREYGLYQFDGLKCKKIFSGGGQLGWINPTCFAFTSIDAEKRERVKGSGVGWLSVVMYNTASDKLTTVIPATDTADYELEEVYSDKNLFLITESTVEKKSDWDDFEKVKTKQIKKDIPKVN